MKMGFKTWVIQIITKHKMEPKAKDKKLIIMMTWIQILQKCKKEGLEPS